MLKYYKFIGQHSEIKLEPLERLPSEDTPCRLMITHTIESCWIPSQNKVEWPWRYRSRSKVITCDTPSHASDHLYQTWKESIRNCRCYRVDTIFKAKAKWPWRYRSRSKVIICNTPSHTSDHLCYIWKESIKNCRFFFSGSRLKNFKNLPKIQISRFQKNVTRDTPSNDSDHLCHIQKESVQNCWRYRADTIF